MEKCESCAFYRPLSISYKNSYWACYYALDTGELRRCKVENCDKYVPKEETECEKKEREKGGV